MHQRRRHGVLAATLATLMVGSGALASTSIQPYAISLTGGQTVTPLLSVDDAVPLTSNPALRYRMVGIPDGLGAYRADDDHTVLFMNHELTNATQSQPVIDSTGTPVATYRGAFVSKYTLDEDGDPISGERAYDEVYVENTFVGPAPETTNSTPGMARFCSGFLAGPEVGFDRQIYLAGEESEGAATFDGRGGLAFAIFDGEAHALPGLGHFAKENVVVQPDTGKDTVIFPTEDGPSTPDSQLYMYIAKKNRSSHADPLSANGLTGGTLYVFRSLDPARKSEKTFTSGTISGEWVAIQGAAAMSDQELEAGVDRLGAMTFIRPEDAAFDPDNSSELYFVTTGGNAAEGNELGRLYSLQLNKHAWKKATLTVEYNADQIIAAGGDTAVSPDNIDISSASLMIQEDGTSQSRQIMAAKGRDGSIWRFPIGAGGVDVAARARIVELDPPGRDGVAVGPGVWETSGIIDVSEIFGPGTWLFDVQAHSPTSAPSAGTVEDGQLLLLRTN